MRAGTCDCLKYIIFYFLFHLEVPLTVTVDYKIIAFGCWDFDFTIEYKVTIVVNRFSGLFILL